MNMTPTREQVAKRAAEYATSEWKTFSSWFSYEDEFAHELLKDKTFICTVDYTIPRVVKRWDKHMQAHARGFAGAQAVAYVAGNIVGEWLGGGRTIDQIMDSY